MSTYHKDGATITFASKLGWKSYDKILTASEINRGFDPSINTINISGSSVVNKPKKITTLKITADEGKYFSIPPYIKSRFKSRFRFKRIKVEKTNNKPTVYIYDLIYKGSNKSYNNLSIQILYKTETIPTTAISINNISFGNTVVNSDGEHRVIKIYGTPTATFGVAINENVENIVEYTTTDIDGATARSVNHSYIDKINDVSILSTPNSRTEYNYAKNIGIMKGTIGSKGFYSFKQVFPSIVSNRTKVNGTMAASGASGGTKIIFNDLTDVRVGDRIFSSTIASTSTIKVASINPDEDNVGELTLDGTVTLADKAEVTFKRKRCYSIDFIPDLTSTLSSNIPTTDPNYRLHQYMDPTLTIRNSISGIDMTITHNNGLATDLARGAELDITYNGKANTTNNKNMAQPYGNKSKFIVSMLLDIHASENFTGVLKPKFSSIDQSKSDWTNSVAKENGGTKVNIHGVKWGATGENKITLTYIVEIKKLGTEDVIMELDLDEITTIA